MQKHRCTCAERNDGDKVRRTAAGNVSSLFVRARFLFATASKPPTNGVSSRSVLAGMVARLTEWTSVKKKGSVTNSSARGNKALPPGLLRAANVVGRWSFLGDA